MAVHLEPPLPRLDGERLLAQLAELGEVGTDDSGGRTRIALSDTEKAGRDLLVSWMRELELEVRIDRIGNIFGTLPGGAAGTPALMLGSHIDSVANAGALDGCYGVLAGLAVARAFREAGIEPLRPITVAAFTNEEGVRYQPDMLGSLVYAGGLPVEQALDIVGSDGSRLGDELRRIGYAGDLEPGGIPVHEYLELHIEQGPVLEAEGLEIGVVENLQGISWQQVTVRGHANHAGTTPTRLRYDAGLVAATIVQQLRLIADESGTTLATVGCMRFEPNLINVIPRLASFSVDLRDPDEQRLQSVERRLQGYLASLAEHRGVQIDSQFLARTRPVVFDGELVEAIEAAARRLGLSHRRMTSGAGHDAQMIARIAPAAMIFVPSRGGISHNPRESTDDEHLLAGARLLLELVVDRLGAARPAQRRPAVYEMPALPDRAAAAPLELLLNPRVVHGGYPTELRALMNIAQASQDRAWLADWAELSPRATPLWSLPDLAARLGIARLCIKDESLRSPLASFKALGAPIALVRLILRRFPAQGFDAASLLAGEQRSRLAGFTVVSATDGNHGRALAAAARSIGCDCVIVLHAHVSEERERAIAAYGAQIRRIAGNYDDSVEEAASLALAYGWQVVADTSWEGYEEIPRDVMQGYGIIAEEVIETAGVDAYTHIILQGGVGGLAAGIASYYWERCGASRPTLLVVEPSQADCLYQSALAGAPARATGSVDSVMAGLACGATSPLAWRFLEGSIDAFLKVEDADAVAAMGVLAAGSARDIPVIAGESGAAGLAGLLHLLAEPERAAELGLDANARVLLINTEGATAPSVYEELVGEPVASVLARQRDWAAANLGR